MKKYLILSLALLTGCHAAETNQNKELPTPVVDAIAKRPVRSNPAPIWEIVFELRTNPSPMRVESMIANNQIVRQTTETSNTVSEIPVLVVHAWNARTSNWVTFRDDYVQRITVLTNYLETNTVPRK